MDAKYQKVRHLGSGAKGEVYEYRDTTEPGKFVAVKEMNLSKIRLPDDHRDKTIPRAFIREFGVLEMLDHKNVIRYIDAKYDPKVKVVREVKKVKDDNDDDEADDDEDDYEDDEEYEEADGDDGYKSDYGDHYKGHYVDDKVEKFEEKFFLVMERAKTSLNSLIDKHKSKKPSPKAIKRWLRQILEGLSYCHLRGVIHRDLKPNNILMGFDGELKIADFDTSRISFDGIGVNRKFSFGVGTPGYLAPERILASNYDTSSDMWAVGCIFSEMLTRSPLFFYQGGVYDRIMTVLSIIGYPGGNILPEKIQNNLKEKNPEYETLVCQLADLHPNLDEVGLDLLKQMLHWDANKRITAKMALQHPYLL